MDLVAGPLGSVIPKLALLLKDEFELQTGVRKKITCLSRDLEWMHADLRRVAEMPPEQLDDGVKLWARDVRELSYNVEDILDTFLVRVEGREARDPNRFKRAAKKIGKLFSKSKARHQIADMVKIINEQADAVAERHRRYRAEDFVSKPAAPHTVDPRLQAMYKEVTQLVGIERPSDELVSMLSPLEVDKMKMVSVVGVGGLGKTTLAKAVYDKLKADFQCTAFVPVGREPDLKKVFRDILIGLDKEKYMDSKFTGLDEKQLIDEIQEYLTKKRYLVVIDDIWKIGTWQNIQLALVQKNNNGSRVIVTTRHSDVADEVGEAYKLAPLAPDPSEKLFYTRIFGANGTCPNNELKEVSDKILKKCGGVPLAIITMASLLVGKSKGEWMEVCRSIVFSDKKNQQVSDTEWILSLSYYDLPANLKTCLLYLSAFPEEAVIDKDMLIWKWVAEGFIKKEQGFLGSLFEVGERYFNELINRSMIQALENEYNGIVYACSIHDMVLDLLRVKSREENFVTIISGDNHGDTSSPNDNILRRLAHQNRTVEQTYEDTQADLQHVRTFMAVACRSHMISFLSFKHLRVLALEDCNGRDDRIIHLEPIESLLHLRYLGLIGTYVGELPKGIGALKFLQTLELGWIGVNELPSDVGMLTKLICLRAGATTVVPNGIIQKLTSLEDLQICVWHDKVGQFVKDLGNLCELRVLDAAVEMTEDAIMQSDLVDTLGNLRKLRYLKLHYAHYPPIRFDEAIWGAAVLPQSLQHLYIFYINFTVLPACINPSDLPNLTSLGLSVRDMDEQSLRMLGGLPELRHLNLWTASTVTITVGHADDFQKLISLLVYSPVGHAVPRSTVRFALNEDSSVGNGDGDDDVTFGSEKAPPVLMPNLRLLSFEVPVQALMDSNGSCDRLGLECLPSLQKVEVSFWCRNAFADDVDKQEAALRHAIEAHPNRPTLKIDFVSKDTMRSRQAAPDLVTEEETEHVGSSSSTAHKDKA